MVREGHEGGAALLARFAREFRVHVGADLFRAAAFVLAGALVEGIGLLLLIPLLGLVLGSAGDAGALGQWSGSVLALLPDGSAAERLALLLLVFALLMALRSYVLLTRDTLLARLQIGFVQAQRLQVMRHVAGSSWAAVSRLRHGRIAHLLGADMFALRDAAHYLIQCAVSAVMLGVNLLLAFLISPLLALILMAILVTGLFVLRPLVRRSRDLGTRLSDANLALMNNATQFLGGLKVALSQNLQQSYVEEFETTLHEAAERETRFARQRARTSVALAAFAAFVAAAAMLIDVALVGSSPPALIALLVVLARMHGPATLLQQSSQQIFHALPAFAKVRQLAADLPPAAGVDQGDGAEPASGDIQFERVSFSHDRADGGGVRDLSLSIAPGTFLGIVGASGAGKTTFVDLLTGLYPPEAGRVLVGGTPLAGKTITVWRDSLSYVPQDPYLFHDTIRANLAWARPGASEAELWEALDLAGAAALVRGLEAGLDTVVGERGGLLSGGERQRIALARAVVRRPRIIILDEATNALDIESEREVLQRLSGLPGRPTIVMIAHRDQSLAFCERIIRLEAGRLVEDRQTGAA